MGMNPKEIKNRVEIKDVMEYYGLSFSKNFTLCPFHGDKKPSLSVKGNHFRCWSCNEHGDVIDFVAKYFTLSLMDAAKKIDSDFSLGLAVSEKKVSPEEKRLLAKERKAERETREGLMAAEENWKEKNKRIYDFYVIRYRELFLKTKTKEEEHKLCQLEEILEDYTFLAARAEWDKEKKKLSQKEIVRVEGEKGMATEGR